MRIRLALAAAFMALAAAEAKPPETALPTGFVRLADVEKSIRQDMLYAGPYNFLGRAARGYAAPACILTEKAATALASAQSELAKDGLTLVVFDCYRPRRAVADFVAWTRGGRDLDPRWHPAVRRDRLIAEGYIASRSAHSRGSTVDVGIAPTHDTPATDPGCGAAKPMLDFGTGFDCFDPKSRTGAVVAGQARANREKLLSVMDRAGFRNYPGEWWHFTLRGEPFARQGFDFTVQ